MQNKFRFQHAGQGLVQEDMTAAWSAGATADDRTLQSLLSLAPFDGSTVSRGIIPYRGIPLVTPVTGGVSVAPFRAVLGSRVAAATSGLTNYEGIMSGVCAGATTLGTTVPLDDGDPTDPRWDLVYAVVTVDVPGSSVNRKVKAAGSGVVTSESVSPILNCTVTLDSVSGTAQANPEHDAVLPADTSTVFHIPLAWVAVPSGFTAASTPTNSRIAVVAPVLTPDGSRVASSNSTVTTTMQHAWATGSRPARFLPSTMAGDSRTYWVFLDLSAASTANHSHADGDVVIAEDLRGRIVRWEARVVADSVVLPTGYATLSASTTSQTGLDGWGNTVASDGTLAANTSAVAILQTTDSSLIDANFGLACSMTTDGYVRLVSAGNPRVAVWLLLEVTGRRDNY